MPFSLLSPPPSPPPLISPAASTFSANKLFVQRRSARTIVEASKNDDDEPAFNPFGFVTDNPSSRSAIQLPESPAEDGNVGQMLYVITIMSSVIIFSTDFHFLVWFMLIPFPLRHSIALYILLIALLWYFFEWLVEQGAYLCVHGLINLKNYWNFGCCMRLLS